MESGPCYLQACRHRPGPSGEDGGRRGGRAAEVEAGPPASRRGRRSWRAPWFGHRSRRPGASSERAKQKASKAEQSRLSWFTTWSLEFLGLRAPLVHRSRRTVLDPLRFGVHRHGPEQSRRLQGGDRAAVPQQQGNRGRGRHLHRRRAYLAGGKRIDATLTLSLFHPLSHAVPGLSGFPRLLVASDFSLCNRAWSESILCDLKCPVSILYTSVFSNSSECVGRTSSC